MILPHAGALTNPVPTFTSSFLGSPNFYDFRNDPQPCNKAGLDLPAASCQEGRCGLQNSTSDALLLLSCWLEPASF